MSHQFSNALLSSTVLGLALGLGIQAQAATFYPGTTLLNDTSDFLDFQINLRQLFLPYGTNPPGVFGFPPPGPVVPLLLGQNWNVYANNFFGGSGITEYQLFVQQATQVPGAPPRASFFTSTNKGGGLSLYQAQASYLASAPAQVFDTVTCTFGSSNCVSYEFGVLYPTIYCQGCNSPLGLNEPIIEIKGFFNPQQVPEPETGIGALAALGLMMLVRARQGFFKTTPKSLP
jgi:hypothetical protein